MGFAIVETRDNQSKNFVEWLKNDKNGSCYWHFCFITLILILKYSMLLMGIPKGDIDDLTILAMICSVLTFS